VRGHPFNIRAAVPVGEAEWADARGPIPGPESERRPCKQRIEGEQLQALYPVAFAIERDKGRRKHGHRDGHDLERMEEKRHRVANDERDEHQDGRDEQRDLRAASDGDLHRERHLVLPGRDDGAVVFGRVPHQGHDNDADEEFREAEVGERRASDSTRISAWIVVSTVATASRPSAWMRAAADETAGGFDVSRNRSRWVVKV